ncbi:fasciclin domain-containing protein [Paucibacter sp. TC2R-5]|uniref:fasciclin domain-containing protein n=1 Tax=Paucibacter sp. TC2R-5 TaxID=2893555 RepID=UPI0021E42C01|nr:fasciclin domain-containing protein [Paucibacter sp. TC2R-5]MCV2359408.1 fasciclin domain-containing protein [Paucibacter sp. TC2R-5]
MLNWLKNTAQPSPARPASRLIESSPSPSSASSAAILLDPPARALRHPAALDLGDGCWREALQAAGLSSLMHSPGNLALLVPSDRAFLDLLHELKLSWPELCADLPRLRRLLLGHVLMDGSALTAARPGALLRTADQGVLQLLGDGRLRDALGRHAQTLGVIAPRQKLGPVAHLIDRVLRPAERGLLDLLADSPAHSDFLQALRSTGLSSWLSGGGPITVLAPCNSAWAAQVEAGQYAAAEARAAFRLEDMLGRHLVAGRWLSDEIPWGGQIPNLSGEAVSLSPLGLISCGPSSWAQPQSLHPGSDRIANNGVLHRLACPNSLA